MWGLSTDAPFLDLARPILFVASKLRIAHPERIDPTLLAEFHWHLAPFATPRSHAPETAHAILSRPQTVPFRWNTASLALADEITLAERKVIGPTLLTSILKFLATFLRLCSNTAQTTCTETGVIGAHLVFGNQTLVILADETSFAYVKPGSLASFTNRNQLRANFTTLSTSADQTRCA